MVMERTPEGEHPRASGCSPDNKALRKPELTEGHKERGDQAPAAISAMLSMTEGPMASTMALTISWLERMALADSWSRETRTLAKAVRASLRARMTGEALVVRTKPLTMVPSGRVA